MLRFLCPNCKAPLAEKGRDAACENGHLFDRAKEGYFYLLPPKSAAPGDNAEMVRARRDFLDCGFYSPLQDAIANEIVARFDCPITLVDAGCGTGFYLSKIIEKRQNADDVYIALDISKNTVKICAKRNCSAECAVASVYDIPLPDNFADVVVCVFYALRNGRVHQDFERRRHSYLGISVRKSSDRTSTCAVQKRS